VFEPNYKEHYNCFSVLFKMNIYLNLYFCFILQIFEVQVEAFIPFADLNDFGSCVVHLKRFRDNLDFVDLTSMIILAQLRSSERFPLFSIFNASDSLSGIQPVGSVREECSLNIMIGIIPISRQLFNFMLSSRYTFNSNPHSIYIVLLDPSGDITYVDRLSTIFPVSIFFWYVPVTNPIMDSAEDELSLEEPRFWYVCVRCGNFYQPIEDNRNIRFLSELSYESNWSNSKLVLQAIFEGPTVDINGCEKYLWEMWLAPIGDRVKDDYKYCSKSLAFTDILARSVHPNMTVFRRAKEDFSQEGFYGYFINGIWGTKGPMQHWRASNIYFNVPASSSVTYCDCQQHSESISFRGWLTCFDGNVWISIFVVSALVHSYVCIQHYFHTRKLTFNRCVNFVFDIVEIVIRQGNCKSCLIAFFSLGIFIVYIVFENSLTSSLIKPDVEKELIISDLIKLGYRILYVGSSVVFGSQLMHVERLFNMSNVHLKEDNVERLTDKLWNDPESFSTRKLALFAFVTPGAVTTLHKQIQSLVARKSCLCRTILCPDLTLPSASTYLHGMKFRIFHLKELLMQSGIDQLFDLDLANPSPDLINNVMEFEASGPEKQFLSLQNLVPFLVCICILAGISGLVFLIETNIAACIHGRRKVHYCAKLSSSIRGVCKFCVNN
jgi:hypothetical protein